jgi:hypothetical protein
MQKSRLQSAFTSFVALILFAQFVLTAGHVHLIASHDPHGVALATSLGKGSNRGSGHSPAHDIGDCALCWAQSVAGSTLIPPAPAPQFPWAMSAEPLAAEARSQASQERRCAVRPRAPPQIAGWQLSV